MTLCAYATLRVFVHQPMPSWAVSAFWLLCINSTYTGVQIYNSPLSALLTTGTEGELLNHMVILCSLFWRQHRMKCHWKDVKMSFYGQTFPWSRLLDDCCRKLFYFEDVVTMDDYSMFKSLSINNSLCL